MKLYYSPAACSLSPHIVLRESGLPFDLIQVNIPEKRTVDGADYTTINAKGQVPVLQLDDGQLLTEGPAIVQYVADQVPEKNLVPAAGTLSRYRVQEWLNFISSEIHKNFGLIFKFRQVEGLAPVLIEAIAERIGYVNEKLEGHQYLVDDTFSVADAYLFTALSWCKFLQIDLARWPAVSAYVERIAARPAVQAALRAEGLLAA